MEQKKIMTRGALLLQNAAKVIQQWQLTATQKDNEQPCILRSSRKRVMNRRLFSDVTSTPKQAKKVTAKFF